MERDVNKLRIGFLLNSKTVCAYEAIFIRNVIRDPRFEVVGIFLFTENKSYKRFSKKKSFLRNWIWEIWSKYFLLFESEALKPIDLSFELSIAQQINVEFISDENDVYSATHSALTSIANLNVDVIINCQKKNIRGDILSIPKLGIWSFYDNNEQHFANGEGFWEVYFGETTTTLTLQRLTNSPETCAVLRRGWFATELTSLAKTKDKAFFEAANWIISTLNQANLDPTLINNPDSGSDTALSVRRYPNTYQMIILFCKMYGRKWIKRFRDFFYFQAWNIAIIPESIDKISTKLVASKAQWLPELPWPYFQADPFGIETKENYLLILEEYNYQDAKGKLKIATLSKDLVEVSRKEIPTEFKQHHSYPFIFNDKNKQYVLPECLLSKQVMLYQMVDEQGTLKAVASLLNGLPVIDPSPLYFNDRYWIFCTLASAYTDGCTSLYIFHAETLEGPYEPHALNPVKSDVRSSRPGGAFFFKNGKLCRPAQDCSKNYGGALTILEIEKLTPTEYVEQVIDTITPQSNYLLGLHTIAPLGEKLTLIDGKRYVFSLKRIFAKFRKNKALPADQLTHLPSIHQDLALSNSSEIERYTYTQGISEDNWCSTQVEIYARFTEKIKNLLFKVEFPGWQPKKNQHLKIFVNGKLVSKKRLSVGLSSIAVELPSSNSPTKISLVAKNEFPMPFPDKRLRAFRICEMNFKN